MLLVVLALAVCADAAVTNVTLVGPTAGQGRIEIEKDGVFGTVCDDHFGHADALVICRMLGSKQMLGIAAVEGVYGPGSGKIHYDEVACKGFENSIEDCRDSSFKDCFHSEDAGVICDDDGINYRLVGGDDANSGRLEVEINGRWGTVCDDNFNTISAKIVCETLKKPFSHAFVQNYGDGSGPIWLDDVNCTGKESSLFQCNMANIGDNDCDHTEDVGVVCTDVEPVISIRLKGGSYPDEGRVEVSVNNRPYGTICDDDWDDLDATVVCKMLGYTNGTARAVGEAYFGQGTGTIEMDDVECVGNEASLTDCTFGGYGQHDCDHTEDAGVSCNGARVEQVKVRLVGGSNSEEGRVEVYHNGHWGTICDDEFDDREARVVCHMLGFDNGSAIAVKNAFFGPGTGSIDMDELACSGNEDNIGLCRFDGYGIHDCDHTEDAGVLCNAEKQNLTVRLVDGKNPNEGRVEVFYSGTWGTVCDDLWSTANARVVCKMLGLPTTRAEAVRNGFFGQGTGKIWLDNVHCRGNENSLALCRHNAYGATNCDHTEDAGVRCGATVESPIRLVGGVGPFEGRLEVFHLNSWGTVCDDGFNTTEATIACAQLGYPTNNPIVVDSTGFGPGQGRIWLDNVNCNGNEPNLDLCTHNAFGLNNCDHDEDVGIICRTHGLECYNCDGLDDPKTCNKTVQCAAGESCEEAEYISHGQTKYTMTCQSKLLCDAIAAGPGAIGKRATKRQGQTLNVKCCETPLCNRNLIKTSGSGSSGGGSGTCADDPKVDCNSLDSMSICQNPQAAKIYCRKHCGLCS